MGGIGMGISVGIVYLPHPRFGCVVTQVTQITPNEEASDRDRVDDNNNA